MSAISNLKVISACFLLVWTGNVLAGSNGGIFFEKTRLIIDDGLTSGSILLRNESDHGVMTLTKMKDNDFQPTAFSLSMPRLFMTRPGKTSVIKVEINPEKLQSDRETLMWLYAKMYNENPLTLKGQELVIHYENYIKVFYRPKGMSGNIFEAIKNIKWSVKEGKLIANNDSPFNLTMTHISINGKKQSVDNIVKPFSVWNTGINANCQECSLNWSAVNDYGTSIEFERRL